ncbi:MAG TPA: lactate racemase domain-containing protein [Negativicutes bacterium]|nr:lactate racemase domain-containing protein [Negativicutes bacterium]
MRGKCSITKVLSIKAGERRSQGGGRKSVIPGVSGYGTIQQNHKLPRAVKPGGVVILLSECKDIKEPPDFAEWFNLLTKQDMERELRKNFTVPGYAALWEVEKATAATYIMVTLPGNADLVKKVGMIPVSSLDEAMSMALKLKRNPEIIIMPQGANTLPILS